MKEKGLYYFVSDVHLGLDYKNPEEREHKFAAFLNSLPHNTKELFLLGDIFDFWYEYKHVIPRGFTRTLGALAALSDRGVKVHFFNGNHDIWTYNYFQRELGFIMESQPLVTEIEGRRFCMGHGDGLPSGDTGYKLLKSIFTNRFLQFLFSGLHPRWAFGFGLAWSKHNRLAKGQLYEFRGEEEPIVRYAENLQSHRPGDGKIDYFIFGHYHYKAEHSLKTYGKLFIMGEWIHYCDYLVFDGESLQSRIFEL